MAPSRRAIRLASLVNHEGFEELKAAVDEEIEALEQRFVKQIFTTRELDAEKLALEVARARGTIEGMRRIVRIPAKVQSQNVKEEENRED